MKARSKLGLIAALGVIVVVVLLVLRQNPNQNTPLAATSTAPAVTTSATPQPTLVAAITPAAAPTMTAEEQKVMEDVKNINPQSEASSPDQCSAILQTQPSCSITKSAKRITRSEWNELFPQTQFFLVPYTLIAQESQQSRHVLVVEQNGQRYSAETFDALLDVNQIVITDQNRELVAKAFALMTLEDYLGEEVDFTDWQAGKWESGYTYDHYLKAWTKIQGIEFWWWFTFENDKLRFVTRTGISSYHIGNYIDVPLQTLPLPPLVDYRFTSK